VKESAIAMVPMKSAVPALSQNVVFISSPFPVLLSHRCFNWKEVADILSVTIGAEGLCAPV
jgi:hypothetical protein